MAQIRQLIARIGQPIAGIRRLTARYPIAAAVLLAVVAAAAGWQVYQAVMQGGVHSAPPAATTPRPQSSTAAGPAATATPAPGAPSSKPPGPAGGSTAGTSPSQGKPATGAGGVPTTGLRDPFRSPIGSGATALPPVPPLPPGGLGVGGPAGAFRVTGIIRDAVALAIIEEGPRSYVVEAGEVLRPGVRLTAIDARRGVVQLMQDGLPVELRLAGGGKAP